MDRGVAQRRPATDSGAIEAGWAELLSQYAGQTDYDGRAVVVRNGYLPERKIRTGVGPVAVRLPKVRACTEEAGVFRSSLGLPYVRRAKTLDAALHKIWMAPRQRDAERAFDRFIATYRAKYPKAVISLVKDRDALLAFYDFPAEHWVPLRTPNPIESTFRTIRHRTDQARGV